MRVVLRLLFFEFSLAWALLVAGSVRVTAQLWPLFAQKVGAGWRDRWRVRTGLLIGIPITAGGGFVFWCWPGGERGAGRVSGPSFPWVGLGRWGGGAV